MLDFEPGSSVPGVPYPGWKLLFIMKVGLYTFKCADVVELFKLLLLCEVGRAFTAPEPSLIALADV
jgi:hypothetical protein